MDFLQKFLLSLAGLTTFLVAFRLQRVLRYKRVRPIRHGRRNPKEPTHLMIVLGSGGHTAEMLAMLERAVNSTDPAERLDWKDYQHRTWVVGAGDSISAERAKAFEEMAASLTTQEHFMAGKVKKSTDIGAGTYDIVTVPRARAIHQSLFTAPFTSIQCAFACWSVLGRYATVGNHNDGRVRNSTDTDAPDIILCNGPATATVMVLASILARALNTQGFSTRGRLRTVYIESWARVKNLSLSGKILKNIVDRFIVQWPQLEKSSGVEYRGALV